MIQYPSLKRWRVCRLVRRFPDLDAANAYARQHGPRFVHVMPEADGEASAWLLEAHCERESTAHDELVRLEDGAPPGVSYAVLRGDEP